MGHSWGASVAVALALKYPNLVQGLVLASGYYYPTLRPDLVALSVPAVPLVGDVLGHTLSPIASRVMWPFVLAKMFGPRSVPKKFEGFPKEMALRPSQIRASAAESALMIPDAFQFRNEYANLKMPVVIVAGDEDRLIDTDAQSDTFAPRRAPEQVSPRSPDRPYDSSDCDRCRDVSDQRSGRGTRDSPWEPLDQASGALCFAFDNQLKGNPRNRELSMKCIGLFGYQTGVRNHLHAFFLARTIM